jgi:hypothetical protein
MCTHTYVAFNRKMNILSSTKLDSSYGESNIHGHFRAIKSKNDAINYVKKKDKFIDNIKFSNEFEENLQKICLEKDLNVVINFFIS